MAKHEENYEQYRMKESHNNYFQGLTDIRRGSNPIQDMVVCELELLSRYDNEVGSVNRKKV